MHNKDCLDFLFSNSSDSHIDNYLKGVANTVNQYKDKIKELEQKVKEEILRNESLKAEVDKGFLYTEKIKKLMNINICIKDRKYKKLTEINKKLEEMKMVEKKSHEKITIEKDMRIASLEKKISNANSIIKEIESLEFNCSTCEGDCVVVCDNCEGEGCDNCDWCGEVECKGCKGTGTIEYPLRLQEKVNELKKLLSKDAAKKS